MGLFDLPWEKDEEFGFEWWQDRDELIIRLPVDDDLKAADVEFHLESLYIRVATKNAILLQGQLMYRVIAE